MRKLVSILLSICILVVVMITPMYASAYNQDVDIDVGGVMTKPLPQTYTINELAGKYKTQGRTTITNNILMIEYSASGIEFEANCSGDVSVTFNATYFMFSEPENGCYFTVYVDGVKQRRDFCHLTTLGDTTVKLATNLSAGVHTFAIYRQTEVECATVGIKSITLSGQFNPAPKNKEMYIEFVGDSITTAYANLVANGTQGVMSHPQYQDASQGYAFLTATALDADFSIVAQQGRGAKYGYTPETMLDIYPKLCYRKDKITEYDFAREPDYVVIALGTNDMYTYANRHNATLSDVKQGFAELLSLVRSKNPNAKIIWAYNMMINTANDIITSVINEAGGENKGYYSVMLTRNNDGGGGHPSAAGHTVMATELVDFIKNIEGNSPTFVPGNVNGDAEGVVDLDDVVILAQVVAGWQDVIYVEDALDVTGDKSVNLDDVVLLAQFVAGWDVDIVGGSST